MTGSPGWATALFIPAATIVSITAHKPASRQQEVAFRNVATMRCLGGLTEIKNL
jgi:hypothetical protein